ncbi:MAG: KamA family radical SAM protein [Calditrichaeota bacterium]|nr:KamA family radical SAM protein [Calditrichota bacterium]RQW06472.1 MAG: KamA family radical SAM protein [Calditrichota bacterium]
MEAWKRELGHNITDLGELRNFVSLDEKELEDVVEKLPFATTRYYLSLIDPTDPDDPIRRMVVPSAEELSIEGDLDVSGEKDNTKFLGLQHKYRETVLILATHRCSSYCRYCFRKRMVGRSRGEILDNFRNAVEYIHEHKEVSNVLITGGDPLVLDTSIISDFLKMLVKVEHLDFIRIGTRMPVVYPSRFLNDRRLVRLLNVYNNFKKIYLVTHFNHPREITELAREAVRILLDHNIVISNQTVLLRGVNDDPMTMAKLQKKLTSIGILPYYVFQCRPVQGTRHQFQVPLVKGVKIVEGARALCDGHSKRFRFIMSHRAGKIEVVGIYGDQFVFKYHQARDRENLNKIMTFRVDKQARWLDDFMEQQKPLTPAV